MRAVFVAMLLMQFLCSRAETAESCADDVSAALQQQEADTSLELLQVKSAKEDRGESAKSEEEGKWYRYNPPGWRGGPGYGYYHHNPVGWRGGPGYGTTYYHRNPYGPRGGWGHGTTYYHHHGGIGWRAKAHHLLVAWQNAAEWKRREELEGEAQLAELTELPEERGESLLIGKDPRQRTAITQIMWKVGSLNQLRSNPCRFVTGCCFALALMPLYECSDETKGWIQHRRGAAAWAKDLAKAPRSPVWRVWRLKRAQAFRTTHVPDTKRFLVDFLEEAQLAVAPEDWCWSQRPSASPDACCFRPEASSVEVQRRCWPPAMVGVAFLMCCLSVEHGRTVAARALPDVDRWREPVDVEEALRSELAEGFGPLQSAYNAKDAAVLLQLSMAIPKLWATFSATRTLLALCLIPRSVSGQKTGGGQKMRFRRKRGPSKALSGWELLWVTVMPPLLHVHIPSLPLTIARSPTPSAFGEEVTLEAFLQTHVQRVREIWEAPRMGRAQAVWELCHETARLSQSLVLLAMGPYLLQTARERAMLRVAEPPLFQNACCERYRILLWLLRDLQRELGREKLVYVEVGVSKGQTALFLLEALPWLEAYLVPWRCRLT
ncbi:13 kDa deflagellation-inducible protein [Durusdinium trenchii]|uniref:13 kDa deflagellation-inducible protein n=1 Tax=Durusdinium trenchii TaxID=1381693 RepID=A0ABP0PZT1_9DINO